MTTGLVSRTSSDRAVDGLLAGIVAGVVMAGYLMISGMLAGISAGQVLGRFGAQAVTPLVGGLSHLAVSAIYGAIFGILTGLGGMRLPGWAVGLVFGTLLFLLAEFIVLPSSDTPLTETPWIHFLISHLLYGAVLGELARRRLLVGKNQ